MVPTSGQARPGRTRVEAGRLWAGGAATAVVAALVAFVGVIIVEDVFGLPMVQPPLLPVGDSFALRYAVTAAALALVATGVGHLLALTTPRPRSFFGWMVGLATVLGVVLPFAADGTLGGRLATALLNLVIGLCVLSLVSSVLARTVSPGPRSTGTATAM
ncbi:hypothetical protein E4P40_00905 [Blastococcus sp. CT_GayMR20]|uniref:DUF6069 family protein n=1 Tax=Blastococcus sp. CT_GayMR20 TaxID=2559609 RepID=UPI0010738B3E|nr:DUF6069 family protein [Blastococcus sp. CT_GayMR20]TFV92976.1 hypothetical protein E4P40_00905 [Blastococcus sp. CT_GayMR20]